MRKSIARGMLVVLTAAFLANPVLAAERGHHVKQSNPDYWNPAMRTDGGQASAPKLAAKPQQKLPTLPKRTESKAPVDYSDVEIMP